MASAASAGDYLPGATVVSAKNSNAPAVTKGKVMKWDTSNDGYVTTSAAANELGPFAVCAVAAASGDINVTVVTAGRVFVTADGTIEPGDLVESSASTAGEVITYAETSIAATPTQANVQGAMREWRTVIGRYIGHVDEIANNTAKTDAADGDIICIALNVMNG